MNRLILFRVFLGMTLGLLLVLWGGITWDAYGLEEGLELLADEKLDEFARHSERVQGRMTGYESCATVTAGREFVVWGRAIGKVSIWTRIRDESGRARFGGVEYFYVLVEGTWVNTESVALHSKDARRFAQDAFEESSVDKI